MITQATILPVEGGFEFHFAERFPYRKKQLNKSVDFKTSYSDAKYVAYLAHATHIIQLVEDLHNCLIVAKNQPKELIEALRSIMQKFAADQKPNHRQLCADVSNIWHLMATVNHYPAHQIILEMQDTVKYEMTTDNKKWILE